MKLIRATTGNNVDHCAHGLAVFRTIAVAQNLELLDSVDRGIHQNSAVRSNVVIVDSIDRENVARGAVAIHGEIDARFQAFMLGVEVRSGRDAWHQLRQLGEASTIQGQLAHLISLNHVAHRARRCFHLD